MYTVRTAKNGKTLRVSRHRTTSGMVADAVSYAKQRGWAGAIVYLDDVPKAIVPPPPKRIP